MKRMKKVCLVLICAISVLFNAFFRPVRVDAVVAEIGVAVSAAEIIKAFVLSLGATYLTVEGAKHAVTAYDDYVGGTAAEKLDELEEQQITLVVDNTGKKPEPSVEPENSAEPEIDNGLTSIFLTGEVFQFAKDFYTDLFADLTSGTAENSTDIGRYYNYAISPIMSKIYFGGHPSYDSINTIFVNSGKSFKPGGLTQYYYNTSENIGSVRYARFFGLYAITICSRSFDYSLW